MHDDLKIATKIVQARVPSIIAVDLNRGHTFRLGVRRTKTRGTKHQRFKGYTPGKFKPEFL